VAAATLERFGRIDGLINSAYVSPPPTPVESADFGQWRDTIDTNLFGTLNMCRAVLPAMKAQKKGSIVNISTMATRKPFPGLGGYTASKAALNAVTRLLAKEWGPYGVRVNTVAMGWMWGSTVKERMEGRAQAGGASVEEQIETVTAGIPLGVIPTDRQCAGAALAMLSDYCSQVTGGLVDCNGGEFMAL
jgi:NAD(P)-dependent dehydrogenase (short-subunit alcohol dehydrogenase family)